MNFIQTRFEEIFGITLPPQLLSDEPLYLIAPPCVVGSKIAAERNRPMTVSRIDIFDDAPEGYYLMGFHDRGINNFGFFYARIDHWRRIYFRLNYGGAYVDGERGRNEVREFLPRYFEFERQLKGNVKSLKIIESIDTSEVKIVMPDDQVFQERCRPPLLAQPDFEQRFKHVLALL